MSIKIEEVNLKNLGPLSDFAYKFKKINLIYGLNEHGKTFLVEFIYKSLFKNKSMSLREFSTTGQVRVSGLEEKETLFSPSSKKKLEDYWQDSLPGLPMDFCKLLVVKGADLDFESKNAAGIDDRILKEFLSGEGLLDSIGSKIKTTEASAIYENGRVSGGNMGMVKEYNKYRTRIEQIDNVIFQVDTQISGGRRFELSRNIEKLKIQKDLQEKARRYLAYDLANQITDLQGKLESLHAESISSLSNSIDNYFQSREKLESKQKSLEENKKISIDYPWLAAALDNYQRLIMSGASQKPKSGTVWLVLTLIAMALTMALIIFKQPYFGLGMLFLVIIFGFIYLKILSNIQKNFIQQGEIDKIVEDYKNRFGGPSVVQEATLRVKSQELQLAYATTGLLAGDIQNLTDELKNLEQYINQVFKKLTGTKVKQGDWLSTIQMLQSDRESIENILREKENELSRLDIDESNYLEIPVKETYDKLTLHNLTENLDLYEVELATIDRNLQELKQQACGITGEPITIPWEDLIESINNYRIQEVNQYRDITAKLIARIKVNEVLVDLRTIEEKRIEEGLFSDAISQALKATTGHYDRVEKENGQLYVSDKISRYKVSDLSTGAREQVLLGLRIGFAARILANKTLFLILDDAFQHSDWNRRERLVEQLFTLANEGWQIIYFTMDDHIRSLFESNANKVDKGFYQTIVLQ